VCQDDRDMSGHDLYLVLRERLESVADTIHIDRAILDEAQNARGFSNERIARELYISEKTWRRWKNNEAIPADRVDDVAAVLNLDIERPPAQRVVLTGADEAGAVAVALEDIARRLEALEATVGELPTAEDLRTGLESLRGSIARATRGSRATRSMSKGGGQ
jgi:transcriptional regulator with XRE-family HTH domain